MGKSLITSRTFWANLLLLAATYASVLPPDWAALVIAVSNLALRYLTKEPITSIV